ncbi:MAG: bifunctional precorrin-2 dehydrogenase/sirohydrochlorin ferrochelatase [Desulfurococcales archaeon]|nr:bifunctional precorrin-2 dehydrogenase/sirohydrochlorin ferrochelatase [Desulfurococcales archaeon]
MTYTPFYIDLSGKKAVVIGGGSIGGHRARLYSEAGARVVIMAEELGKEASELVSQGKAIFIKARLPGDMAKVEDELQDAFIVTIALPDEELAKSIASLAKSRGVLVNSAVDARLGDVIIPFQADAGGLRVAVTSLGATGLAARIATEKIKNLLDNDLELRTIYEATARLKKCLKARVPSSRLRMPVYFAVIDDREFREYAMRGDLERALDRARSIALEVLRERGYEGVLDCI